MTGADALELSVAGAGGVTLSGQQAGDGPAIVLAHGLTATRRYVLHGSRSLERSGYRVISYDARGHGRSSPAPEPRAYGYELLAEDLRAVLDASGVERALLAGVSMGAHTIVRFALEHPRRVAALAIITPAYTPGLDRDGVELSGWDALARGLREGGVEGFLAAYPMGELPASLHETVEAALYHRMSLHAHPLAVGDALEAVPRSRPFPDLQQLDAISVPVTVIGSRDAFDPLHPLSVARRYAQAIPGAALLVEEEGGSPLAWQGGRVAAAIAELGEAAVAAGTW